MSFDIRGEHNPFAAPSARIDGPAIDLVEFIPEAEQIRRAHIGHEASIKALGLLQYLGAGFGLLWTIVIAVILGNSLVTGRPPGPNANPLLLGGVLAFYLVLTLVAGSLGFGLRRLQPWARWTMLVLVAVSLLGTLASGAILLISGGGGSILGGGTVAFGGLVYGYFLYLLVAPKAGMVFSREYKSIILQTPYVKNKTSLAAKLILIGLVLAVILGIVYAMSQR